MTKDERFARYQFDNDMRTPEFRNAEKAQVDSRPIDCTGYSAPSASADDVHLFDYELSAYSDTVGYYADGIQRVSPVRRHK